MNYYENNRTIPRAFTEASIDHKPILNGWLTLPCSIVAEIIAQQGFDTLTIDMQHGCIGYECALKML